MEDGITLRDYAAAIISKWWVIVLILVATLVTAVVVSSQLPSQYRVRTQLLLIARTSEDLTSMSKVGTALSVDTLSNLALANDLLETIIQTLNRDNPGSANPSSVEVLAEMMNMDITASENNSTTVLPLLTLTVHGLDPVLLKRIAETWAELFIQRNASLFASQSARSFDFIQSQYYETEKALQAKSQEQLAFRAGNSLQVKRTELNTLTRGIQVQVGGGIILGNMAGDGLFGKLLADLEEKSLALVGFTAEEKTLKVMLDEALQAEPPNWINAGILMPRLSDASTEVASLTAQVNYLEDEIQVLRASINHLSTEVFEIEVAESTFSREIAFLNENLEVLAAKLQEARLAKEEQGGTITVVESPILPQVPYEAPRRQVFFLTGAMGLVVGITMALLVHYIQRGTLRAEPLRPTRIET